MDHIGLLSSGSVGIRNIYDRVDYVLHVERVHHLATGTIVPMDFIIDLINVGARYSLGIEDLENGIETTLLHPALLLLLHSIEMITIHLLIVLLQLFLTDPIET